jgi:hypothetical protein
MNRSVKANTKRGATRDLFAELSGGMEALTDERQGKRKLRTHAGEFKPATEALAQKPFEKSSGQSLGASMKVEY